MIKIRNITWDIEEAVLLMDLFVRIQNSTDKKYSDNKILELSKTLNYRAKVLHLEVTDTFRNPNGIKMKLQNLNYLMSDGQSGLASVSLMDKKVYSLYNQYIDEYEEILVTVQDKYCSHITANEEGSENMKTFKTWLYEQDLSVQAVQSIVDSINKIQHDFSQKKAYQHLFTLTDTKDVLEVISILKKDKRFMMMSYISKNKLSRSLDIYLKFVKDKEYLSKKRNGLYDENLTGDNSNIFQSINEAKYKKILKDHFLNGFRLNSSLEMKKFKRRYSEVVGNEIQADDKKITELIKKLGLEYDGKVYLTEQLMDLTTAEQLMLYIQKLFKEGKGTVFYVSLFQTFSEYFQGYCMYNADMLKSFLSYVNNGNYYIKRSYIGAYENEDIRPMDEIRICMIENGGIYSYKELAELLPHIPIGKIKSILGTNSEFVRNQKGRYFHADIIDLTEEELINIANSIQDSINDKGYISGKELCIKIKENCISAYEKMTAFSKIGIRGAIAYKLREQFSANGNVISKIGDSLSTADVYARYCSSREKFTLEDLYGLRDEIGSHIVYFESVYMNSLRISETEFVAKKNAQFNVSLADKIIDQFCVGDYVPINDIMQFSLFPAERFRWNSYLLEHYIYVYSYKYRLLNRGFNANKCIGVIVKKTSVFTEYDEVLADTIAKNCVYLNSNVALDYLYNNGYIGKRKVSNIDIIIVNAKNIRMKKGQFNVRL